MDKLVKYMEDTKLSLIEDYRIIELQIMNETGDLTILRNDLNLLQHKIKLTKEYLSVANGILTSSNERE